MLKGHDLRTDILNYRNNWTVQDCTTTVEINTMCPRSSDPISYSNLLYKMGNFFLDTRYVTVSRYQSSIY